MRKESSTVQKCKRQMATLGFDSQLAYHRVKLILKIYRDVVWVLSERVEELREYAWELGAQDADTGLIYLQSFAPDMDLQEFEERVCCVMENRMLVDVIDRALLRLKRYPDRGELYYEILTKQFIHRFNSTEKELLDELNGRKICKQSPTLDEGDIHDAVISAMNELFRMQAAKDAVKAGIAAVLAGEEQTMSLPAVELQIRNLQERQLELFQLIVSAGADCTDYDEELQQVNIAKTRLMAQKAELEKEQRGAAAFESRLAELDMALEQASGTLTDFDELTVRQLVSNIKVLDKDSLLICFKDGTEITQAMQRRQTA